MDAVNVSTGGAFPHPRNPAGAAPVNEPCARMTSCSPAASTRSATTCSSGCGRRAGSSSGGGSARAGKASRASTCHWPGRSRTLSLCQSSAPGGFQTQSVIAQAISDGACDAGVDGTAAARQPRPAAVLRGGARTRPPSRARTATSASSTSSRTPSAATRRAVTPSREEMIRETVAPRAGRRRCHDRPRGWFEPPRSGASRSATAFCARASPGASTTTTRRWGDPTRGSRSRPASRAAGSARSSPPSSRSTCGRIVPGYVGIDRDERIAFWRELGKRVHEHGCPYIVQLAHGGRQRDIGGIEFAKGLSSTGKADPLHGFPARR